MQQEILNIVLSALGIIVTGLVGWAVAAATAYLNSKLKDKKMAQMLSKILAIVGDAVKSIFQQFVETLKDEGKFNAEAQRKAKEAAMTIINSQLTPELYQFIKDNYGNVEEWLHNQIETAIYNFKNPETR